VGGALAARLAAAACRVPRRIQAVRVSQAAPPYLSRRRAREGAPNPSRTRGTAPDRPHRPRESRTPRRPEPPVGGAGPTVNAYFHYFPFLLDIAPPPSSSSSPASRTASLHRGAPLRPVATEVRTPVSPYLWTPRPSSRGGTPAAPHRLAAAGDAGHRARLGRVFLQVPPPPPTRARRLPSLAPLAVGSRPVLVTAAPCRRVRVAFAFARASVRAATPSRRRAPQHVRTVTLEARPGLWPFSCAGPPARPPRRLRRHGLAVAGCLAHADAEEGAPPS
jgi:hypothetical protein